MNQLLHTLRTIRFWRNFEHPFAAGAALCWLPEIARLGRAHNDANVCALPARFIENTVATDIVDMFLATEFDGGRHEARVRKIPVASGC